MAKTGIDSAIGIVVLLAAVMIGGLIFVQIGASIPATAIGQQVTGEGITINTTEVTLIPDVFSYQTATSAIVGAQAKVYNATTTFVAGTDYNLVLSNGTLTILTGGALYNTSQTIDVDVLTYQTANYPIVAGTPKIYNATTTFVAGTDYNLVLSNGTLTILTGGALYNTSQTISLTYIYEGGSTWNNFQALNSTGWTAFVMLGLAAFVGAAIFILVMLMGIMGKKGGM